MAPRKKVRRTSSLPGLASEDPLGIAASTFASATAGHPPVIAAPMSMPAPPTPSVPPPAYSFTFTTNLTPTTYQHADKPSSSGNKPSSGEPAEGASPANSTSSNSRKRTADVLDEFYTDNIPSRSANNATSSGQSAPHTRKFSVGHIPRPPNAFILFRSDLVARKAVPTSLEADHSTISKIIGVCWRTLPARQRKRWEQKALEAKAAHKKQYPDYRYTPVHRKGPTRKKAKKEQKKDDDRAAEMAQMLLGGSTGKELEDRIRRLDESNPDTYQTTLSFGPPHNAGGADGQQQFTFVQGFPAVGHTIELPSAPNVYSHPFQPRRHSSAPPADNAFLDPPNGSSSSTASTPRTPARELSGHFFDPSAQAEVSPTDSLVPLSRIARKLPTKSTHHLQPHHFYAEAQERAQAQAAGALNRKVKSSLSRAVKSRAQGLGPLQPTSERDQLFIQSRWTDAALHGADPEGSGEKRKKKKKGTGVIPRDLILPTWDLNAHSSNLSLDGTDGNVFDSQASPVVGEGNPIPGYVAAENYSPSFAPAYTTDEKYGSGHFDAGVIGDMGMGMGPFDMLTYQDYGLPLEGDGLGTDAFGNAIGGTDITSGVANLGGFDFADQFEGLGVGATEDFGYSFFNNGEIGSGPTSVNSTSPHNSDADDAAAYHPYDMPTLPGTLTMAAQDPLASYSPVHQHHTGPQHSLHTHHASSSTSYLPMSTPAQQPQTPQDMMYAAPDWSAFQPVQGSTSAPAPLEPLDPLEPLPADAYAYRGAPGSGPASEAGDEDYGQYPTQSPVVHHPAMRNMAPPPPPQRAPPMQLSLNMGNMGYAHAGPYSAYTQSSAPSPITADIAEQMGGFSMIHASPMKMGMESPAVYHPGHMHTHSASQSMEHLPQIHQHMHSHSHSHSQTMLDAFHEPQQSAGAEQWGDWTHPDPFRPETGHSGSADGEGVGSSGLDPLSPPLGHHGVGVVSDAYRI